MIANTLAVIQSAPAYVGVAVMWLIPDRRIEQTVIEEEREEAAEAQQR